MIKIRNLSLSNPNSAFAFDESRSKVPKSVKIQFSYSNTTVNFSVKVYLIMVIIELLSLILHLSLNYKVNKCRCFPGDQHKLRRNQCCSCRWKLTFHKLIRIVTKKNKIRIWRDVDIPQRLQYTTMKHALKRILNLHRSNAKHR